MKHFWHPDGSGLFQHDPAHINRTWGLTEWIDEDENHMLEPSVTTFKPEHLQESDVCDEKSLSTTIIKTLIKAISFRRVVFIPPIQFHKFVEFTPSY